MKISGLTGAIQFFSRLTDRENPGGQAGYENLYSDKDSKQEQNQSKQTEIDKEKIELVDEKKVIAAIEAFHTDPQALASRLTVTQEGSGPGLKVILRDGVGAVIKSFSGSEFLKLRENSTQDKIKRGRLLDRKL